MTPTTTPTTTGRVAAVTGGAGAIGSAIADRLRIDGHTVVVLDRPRDDRDGGTDIGVDLADERSVRDAAARVLDAYGRCDVLVHCAGAFETADLRGLDTTIWRHVQAVNVESALWLAQVFTPAMAQRGFGRIVFVTSDTQWEPPGPQLLPYIASKGALTALTRVLARDLGADGIAVTAIAPGLTDPPGSRTVNTEADFEAVVARQALRRRLTPADTADTVAFLATDAAAALTGQTVCVDGGLVMR
ncbi:(S)-1-Phenylethanol dehydrogenase [Nocardia cerradoensis]|uniref:(S)-1-Phenylethanol dehydrogenase n=1 Tax=Nocardia cerradoensis TaxID=85688 RepID=A0A231GZ37_9NOCA|nr:SDR family oxidoreductase [Nocardia cerradoensis]OXR41860.1 (S)-1-Phenylethanol dehydrogenase [Nocardia cerradoensis]